MNSKMIRKFGFSNVSEKTKSCSTLIQTIICVKPKHEIQNPTRLFQNRDEIVIRIKQKISHQK